MSAAYDDSYTRREAIRRRMRALGIHAVPSPAILDRIVEEHEVAAALVGRSMHDAACEAVAIVNAEPTCYCAERHDALERIARRLDADADTH